MCFCFAAKEKIYEQNAREREAASERRLILRFLARALPACCLFLAHIIVPAR